VEGDSTFFDLIFFSIHTKDFCEINGPNFLDFEE